MKVAEETLRSAANKLAYTTQDFDFEHLLPLIESEGLCPEGVSPGRFAAMIMQYALQAWNEPT